MPKYGSRWRRRYFPNERLAQIENAFFDFNGVWYTGSGICMMFQNLILMCWIIAFVCGIILWIYELNYPKYVCIEFFCLCMNIFCKICFLIFFTNAKDTFDGILTYYPWSVSAHVSCELTLWDSLNVKHRHAVKSLLF